MLASLADILADGEPSPGAVGAFTCYDLETASAVLRVAEDLSTPVILLIADKAFRAEGGDGLALALRALAEHAGVPVCLQLDHATDIEVIAHAFELGVTAVLADGSKLLYDGNLEFVQAVVELARSTGADVEAELGRIEGDEDLTRAIDIPPGALTDPGQAQSFMGATGAACLAVSIGNVHGAYHHPPQLDWTRLQTIQRLVPVPLALHGASGLGVDMLERAVALGIRKVNFNAELRASYFAATLGTVEHATVGSDLLQLHTVQRDAVAKTVAAKLTALVRADDRPYAA